MVPDTTVVYAKHINTLINTGATIATVLFGLLAAVRVIWEMKESRKQKERDLEHKARDLRWQRGKQAHLLIDDIFDDSLAGDALYMLDWDGREFDLWDDRSKRVEISHEQMYSALRTVDVSFQSESEIYVRDCFDSLFNHLGRVQNAIQIDLVAFGDIAPSLEYYVDCMAENKPVFENFLETYKYGPAQQLLSRFRSWSTASRARHSEVVGPAAAVRP